LVSVHGSAAAVRRGAARERIETEGVLSERFGKYVVVDKIGQGAMGEVFRARDYALGRDVALKTISGERADDILQKRFEREAQMAAALAHPNIITVFDFGQEHGRLFMAMELLEGRELKAVIADGSLPALEDKLAVVEQIASGLAFAHENGVVHRDLKPANIHVQADGQVKIMDFGLAKLPGSDMTRTGMVMGTPHYMSPEQVRGERADSRSDVFALGCILYELLTGRKPFDADSMHAVLFKVLQEAPRDVRDLNPETPIVLVQVLDKALAKKAEARFENGGAFLAALRSARAAIEAGRGNRPLPDLPVPARRGATERSSVPLLLAGAGAGLLLLLLAGGGIWIYERTRTPSPPPPSAEQLAMARAIAANQLELARRRFEARDYREAVRQAERALSLDPKNSEAKALLERAGRAAAEREAAVSAARSAAASGSHAEAAETLWKLMELEPEEPAVAELSAAVEGEFRAHADTARQELGALRQRAEGAGLTATPEYQDALRLSREADTAAQSKKWATAAARWLAARDRVRRLTNDGP
jgi:tRNA A-37 threonylcarbamoyl transferase component Bud32